MVFVAGFAHCLRFLFFAAYLERTATNKITKKKIKTEAVKCSHAFLKERKTLTRPKLFPFKQVEKATSCLHNNKFLNKFSKPV